MKVRGIKTLRSRHGKRYYYDRVSGERIRSEYGTNEFLAEVAALRAGTSIRRIVEVVRTYDDLFTAFRQSHEYQELKPRSKDDHEAVYKYLEPVRDIPLDLWNRPFMSTVKQKARDARSWSFANKVLASVSRTFNWGLEPGYTTSNPVDGVRKYKRPKDRKEVNRAWSEYEEKIVLQRAKGAVRTAVALSLYAGFRQGDVVKIGLTRIGADIIQHVQSKTSDPVFIPIHSELRPYLEESRHQKNRKGLTVVIGERGSSVTQNGLRAMFFKLVSELEEEGLVEPGLTFHGLRHTVGTRLAEAGASDSVIQAMLGHKTPAMAQRYRRDAAKKRSAELAMDLLDPKRRGNDQ